MFIAFLVSPVTKSYDGMINHGGVKSIMEFRGGSLLGGGREHSTIEKSPFWSLRGVWRARGGFIIPGPTYNPNINFSCCSPVSKAKVCILHRSVSSARTRTSSAQGKDAKWFPSPPHYVWRRGRKSTACTSSQFSTSSPCCFQCLADRSSDDTITTPVSLVVEGTFSAPSLQYMLCPGQPTLVPECEGVRLF